MTLDVKHDMVTNVTCVYKQHSVPIVTSAILTVFYDNRHADDVIRKVITHLPVGILLKLSFYKYDQDYELLDIQYYIQTLVYVSVDANVVNYNKRHVQISNRVSVANRDNEYKHDKITVNTQKRHRPSYPRVHVH